MDYSDRHPSVRAGMDRLAQFEHLATPELRSLSASFYDLAERVISGIPDGPDTSDFLRKLWESRNCAIYVAATAKR